MAVNSAVDFVVNIKKHAEKETEQLLKRMQGVEI
jgi:hypothetical protein